MTLTKYSFQHRDYLDWYTKYLPRMIYNEIDAKFNCEDIAMSLMISSMTEGQAPIIIDEIVEGLEIELESVKRISTKPGHYGVRSYCTDKYSSILGLKNGTHPLQASANTTADIINSIDSLSAQRHVALAKKLASFNDTNQLNLYRNRLWRVTRRVPKNWG